MYTYRENTSFLPFIIIATLKKKYLLFLLDYTALEETLQIITNLQNWMKK